MIVPDHWAEARVQHREGRRQVTVRRFGWSETTAADAQAMAEQRANDALRRILSGEAVDRRERKAAYNGAFGVPIREEVLARHGEEVVTRNGYGAHCLNSPRALFADVDFDMAARGRPVAGVATAILLIGGLASAATGRWLWIAVAAFAALALSHLLVQLALRASTASRGGPEAVARRKIDAFIAAHPAWSLRLYRTPNGLRLLATHATFDPTSPEVAAFFAAVGADPLYVRMCRNQRCFRARLTAKPWRIGMPSRMRPRPGIWPVAAERRGLREAWIAAYEPKAAQHAACRFVDTLGSGVVHLALRDVVALHDRASRAQETLVLG